MAKIKYVQLEAGAFLSDIDFQMMSATQRGAFWSILLYLYCNNGKLKNDPDLLRKVCNTDEGFDFDKIMYKFQTKTTFIRHKRVDEELGKAEVKREQAVRAAKTRWNKDTDAMPPHSPRKPSAMPTKLNRTKLNITKENKEFVPPTLEQINRYIQEKRLNVDGVKYLRWYTESGWKDNKGKAIKNWKLKLLSWDNHSTGNGKPIANDAPQIGSPKQSEYRIKYEAKILELKAAGKYKPGMKIEV